MNSRTRNLARLAGTVLIYIVTLITAVMVVPGFIPEYSHAGMIAGAVIVTVIGLGAGTAVAWYNYDDLRDMLAYAILVMFGWGMFAGIIAGDAGDPSYQDVHSSRAGWLFMVVAAVSALIGVAGGRLLPLDVDYTSYGSDRRIEI